MNLFRRAFAETRLFSLAAIFALCAVTVRAQTTTPKMEGTLVGLKIAGDAYKQSGRDMARATPTVKYAHFENWYLREGVVAVVTNGEAREVMLYTPDKMLRYALKGVPKTHIS